MLEAPGNSSLINKLHAKLQQMKDSKVILDAKLAHFATEYHCNGYKDDWSCGYRNCKILLSSSKELESYRNLICDDTSIENLQKILEDAWATGFDQEGAEHFDRKIVRKKDWIGTTEIAALIGYLGIKVKCYDFHRPTQNGTHPLLFEIVEKYFESSGEIATNLPCLYLQHQGHSRSIVGIIRTPSNVTKLILFDPGMSMRSAIEAADIDRLCFDISKFVHRQYSLLMIDGNNIVLLF